MTLSSRLRAGAGRWSLALVAVALLAVVPGAFGHPYHPGAENADTLAPGLALERVGRNLDFDFPVYVTSPTQDWARQFVVEQDGQIRIIKNGRTLSRPFLDVSGLIDFDQGERGLLSMAFAPDFASSRLFYVFYTDRGGDLRVDRLRASANTPDVAVPSTRQKVIEIEHSAYSNHNGGQLQFGRGSDRTLYISTGDGGGAGDPLRTGQNRNSLLGKILRIDPRRRMSSRNYVVPRGNPFVGRAGRDEILHYGLRNPWRFSFDPGSGDMVIGDVGQGSREEVDFVRAGGRGYNFGWRCFEGTLRYSGCSAPGHRRPVLQYSHAGASCSITGGYVLRDRGIPALRGRYLYGDYCTGALHKATLSPSGSSGNQYLGLVVPRLTGFGLDAQGRLYMTSRSYGSKAGAVYRLRKR